MPKFYAPVKFQHGPEVFWEVYKASTDAVERRRAQFFALLAEGRGEADVLEITRYAASTARLLVMRYHQLGLEGLRDGRAENRGAPTVLTPEEQQALAACLRSNFEQKIVWEGKQVQDWLLQTYGKQVYLSRTYEFMRAAGFSPQKPRPRHVKGDEAAKEQFKSKP